MLNIERKVIEVFSKVMSVEAESVNPDSSPDTIGQWDSRKHMSLVLALEQEFGTQFTDEEIVEMLNVGLIILILKEKL